MRTVSVGGVLMLAAVLGMSSAAVIRAQVSDAPTSAGPANAGSPGRTILPRASGPSLQESGLRTEPSVPTPVPRRAGLSGRLDTFGSRAALLPEADEQVEEPAPTPVPEIAQLPRREAPNPFAQPAAREPFVPATPAPGFAADPAEIPPYSPLLGPRSASLTLDWVTPETIILGQEADFELVLRNRGRTVVEQVIVEQVLPQGFRMIRATPPAQQAGGEPSWTIARIEPAQESRITLRLIPDMVGVAQSQARVHFSAASSAAFRVVEPKLEVEAEVPRDAIVGNQAILNATVKNPGSGRATNVILTVQLPKSLVAVGQNLRYELGTLNPGEARSVRILAQVTDLGLHQCKFLATADGNLRDEEMREFNAIGAKLDIVIDGPKLRYVTRPADYEVRVRNTGTSAAHNVHLQVRVPKAFGYLDGGRHGRFDSQTKTVNWFVGQLDVGKEYVGQFKLRALEPGNYPIQASAEAERGHRANAEHLTQIQGIAALLLEVVDVADPIEVGAETLYEILVTNQGTGFATNVQVIFKAPDGIDVVGAKGPVQPKVDGRVVTFAPLPKLAPRADAIYRVQCRGVKPGDHRIEVQALADSLDSPVIELESTKVYED